MIFSSPRHSFSNIAIFYFGVAKLHHGQLEHADGNGDWVLTIFTALSFVRQSLDAE